MVLANFVNHEKDNSPYAADAYVGVGGFCPQE